MLTIHRHQRQAFIVDRLRRFEDRAARHLMEAHEAVAAELGADGLRGVIRLGMDRALAYGLSAERDARFPWARALLTAPELAPRRRMDRIGLEVEALVDAGWRRR